MVSEKGHVHPIRRGQLCARWDARPLGSSACVSAATTACWPLDTVRPGSDLVTVTDGGFAKRTLTDWNTKGRGGSGCRPCVWCRNAASLVGAVVCEQDDTIFAIASNGVVIRTPWPTSARRARTPWV